MSYEKFLMQLRRIGKQMMIFGACGVVFSLGFSLALDTLINFTPWTVLILAGMAIYPTKHEE